MTIKAYVACACLFSAALALDVGARAEGTPAPVRAVIEQRAPVFPNIDQKGSGDARIEIALAIGADGKVRDCQVTDVTPAGKGFGKAVCIAAWNFKFGQIMGPDGKPAGTEGMRLRINYHFDSADASDNYAANPHSKIMPGEYGYIVVATSMTTDGKAEGCDVVEAAPVSHLAAFRRDACRKVKRFRFKPITDETGKPMRVGGLTYRFGFTN